ncbi:hypothetical protein MIMGU_mgv1a0223222mg, partial [Erythranthe guttata]
MAAVRALTVVAIKALAG